MLIHPYKTSSPPYFYVRRSGQNSEQYDDDGDGNCYSRREP